MDNIIIVKYQSSTATYYYLGSTKNGGPRPGQKILKHLIFGGEESFCEETLVQEDLFTKRSWNGGSVVVLEGGEKLRIAKLFYSRIEEGWLDEEE